MCPINRQSPAKISEQISQVKHGPSCFQVRLLPEGAIQVPESSSKPLQGRIEKPLAGSSGQSWTNRVSTFFELLLQIC